MEQAKKKKLRSMRVIATNMFMGLSVVVIVSVLTLVAMGYSFNREWGLEQSGLVQINSRPSGAIVEIDGAAQASRTEMSKMLSDGEHMVRISKPGYDVWERKLNVESGLLTRVDWARLFPVDKVIEDVHAYESLRLTAVSPDKQYIVTLAEDTAKVQLINIRGDDVKYSELDLGVAMGLEENTAPAGLLEIAGWNKNSDKFLLKWTVEEKTDWLLVDIGKLEDSVNLSARFLLNFDDLLIASDAADKIWALEGGNLRMINVSELTISGVLVDKVETMTHNSGTVGYVRNDEKGGRTVEVFKDGEKGGVMVQKIGAATDVVRLALGSYWGDDWIVFSMDNRIFVRSGAYPSYGGSADTLETIAEHDIGFVPTVIEASPSGRFAAGVNKKQVVMMDVELKEYWEYEMDTEMATLSWLDNFLTWEISENKLVVRDFDGNNRREVSEAASGQVAAMTVNNRWVYFVAPFDDEVFVLKRFRL